MKTIYDLPTDETLRHDILERLFKLWNTEQIHTFVFMQLYDSLHAKSKLMRKQGIPVAKTIYDLDKGTALHRALTDRDFEDTVKLYLNGVKKQYKDEINNL